MANESVTTSETTVFNETSMTDDPTNTSGATDYQNYKFNPWMKYNEVFKIDLLLFYGPINPYFKIIHYSALGSLAISIIFSVYTLIYQIRRNGGNVFSWKIGAY